MRAKWEGAARATKAGVFAPARGSIARSIGPRLFLWPELRARDAVSARRFYAAVLGCADSLLPGDTTAVLSRDEEPIAAIAELSDGERAEATTDRWRLYFVRRTLGSVAEKRLVGRA